MLCIRQHRDLGLPSLQDSEKPTCVVYETHSLRDPWNPFLHEKSRLPDAKFNEFISFYKY